MRHLPDALAVGDGADPALATDAGPCAADDRSWRCVGSEYDGAFAEFTKTFAADALPTLEPADVVLASMPCTYSTAEGTSSDL